MALQYQTRGGVQNQSATNRVYQVKDQLANEPAAPAPFDLTIGLTGVSSMAAVGVFVLASLQLQVTGVSTTGALGTFEFGGGKQWQSRGVFAQDNVGRSVQSLQAFRNGVQLAAPLSVIEVGLTGVSATTSTVPSFVSGTVIPFSGMTVNGAAGELVATGTTLFGSRHFQTRAGYLNAAYLGTDWQARESFQNDPGDQPPLEGTVALTGSQSTTGIGTLLPSVGTIPITGYQRQTGLGTLTPSSSAPGTIPLVGQSITITRGLLPTNHKFEPDSVVAAMAPGTFASTPSKALTGVSSQVRSGALGSTGGSSGVSLPLVSVQSQTGVGALVILVSDLTIPLTGREALAGTGTLTATKDFALSSYVLLASEVMGTLTPSVLTEIALTPVVATGSLGTLGSQGGGAGEVAISAVTTTLAQGSLIATLSLPLTSITSGTAIGILTPTASLTAVTATGATGTFQLDSTLALTGVFSTGHIGTISPPGETNRELSGVAATSYLGTLGSVGSLTLTLTGVSATAVAGEVTINPLITGVVSTTGLGTLTVVIDSSVPLTGVSAQVQVGRFRIIVGHADMSVVTSTGGSYITVLTVVGGEFHG